MSARGKRPVKIPKRIDKSWRGWGIHILRPRSWWMFDTPIGLIAVDYHRSVTKQGLSRGRRREWDLRIPLTKKWQIHLATPGKDYLTLVGGPKYLRNLNWIIDEFDSSFNDLAIASLRYHLDYSVCDNEHRRPVYEDLIFRLSLREPTFTDEEMAILHPPGWTFEDDVERRDGRTYLKPASGEVAAIYEAQRKREDEYYEQMDQARHDFVDIMRALWS